MALVNHAKHEINAKIVFCGAAGAGKDSLLKTICTKLPPYSRSQLKSTSFQQDRMLFFDFTHPEGCDPDKYNVRLHVYTLTGNVTHENAWKMVLKGVDGIVFVADSDPEFTSSNRRAFEVMQAALNANGKRMADIPAVVICTGQGMPEPVQLNQIRSDLSLQNLPLFAVDPLSGSDVMDPMCELIEVVLADLEALGLSLQSPVWELTRLAPGRAEKVSPDIHNEKEDQELSLTVEASGDPQNDTPLLSLDGNPKIAEDGSLTVGVKVSCCGRISEATLKISIHS